MPKPTIPVDELRARFQAARRMPQFLEIRDRVRLALRQVDEAMNDDDSSGGDSAELSALWEALKSLLAQIDEKIGRTATLDDLERRAAGQPLDGAGRDWQRRCCEFSIVRAIAAQVGIDIDAGAEREVSQELTRRSGRTFTGVAVPLDALSIRARDVSPAQLRALERRDLISTTTPAGGPGGALIATVLDPTQFVDVLRPQMAVRQLGARVISNLTANLNLPRMTAAATAAWFAENSAIVSSQEEFDDVPLRPRHMGVITEVSRNMLQQSSPDIEALVRMDLAQVLARGVDAAAIQGAGTAIEPLGIVTDPATGTIAAAAPSYDLLVDLSSLLAEANALEGSLGWLANATVRGALLKIKDGYQRPYGLDVLFQGFPYVFSNLAAGTVAEENPIVFGNWNDLTIAMWSELDVLVNPYDSAAYSKGNVLIRGAMTIDVCKRHVESFAWMSAAVTGTTTASAPTPPSRRAAA